MPTITCRNINRKIEVRDGANLLAALDEEGIRVYRWPRNYRLPFLSTWFDASFVEIVEGMDHLSERNGRERKRLKFRPDGYRLASQCWVYGDVTLNTCPGAKPVEEYW